MTAKHQAGQRRYGTEGRVACICFGQIVRRGKRSALEARKAGDSACIMRPFAAS